MTQRFYVSLQRTPLSDGFRFALQECSGADVADSADGRRTAVVFDAAGHQAAPAARVIERWGDDRFDPLRNSVPGHGLLLIDRRAGSVQVVMPRIGLGLVFCKATADGLMLASEPRQLLASETPSDAITPTGLFRYLYFHTLPAPGGIFRGIDKLSGGHWLTWTESGTQLERYWRPDFDADHFTSEAEATAELHRSLRAAVGRSLESSEHAGAFLSGGLDSSTVAGYAAELRPGIRTVTMGFDAQGYDEMEFARIASRRFATNPLEYYVTPEDVLRTLPMIAAAFPEPFGNSSAAAVYHCARIAREHGIELLLAGDGGDELFGGNDRYAKQLVFERYGHLPAAVRHALLEPAVASASRVTSRFLIGKALSYINQANVPLPDRLQHYNFLHQHDPEDVFTDELLAGVDRSGPIRELRDEYSAPHAASAIDRMLFLDWKFTLHDNDLVKVNTMCELAGVNVGYPMLDPDVVDFSLRLPADWKVRDGQLRWFYKRAMQGFLPNEILNKTKHGFGLPFGVWTRTHEGLRRLSEDALASLATRGFFRPQFLSDAKRLHREGHASFYGELVWILTVLELWLQSHAPNSRI